MRFYTSFVTLAIMTLVLAAAETASAQRGFGGCAQGQELGYVTALAPTWMTSWRGNTTAERRLIPGFELRLCRFEGDRAVVTLWTAGHAYELPRNEVGSVRSTATVREVTEWDLACTGREINRIQSEHGAEQDWYLFDLAWDRDVSLTMLNRIRVESAMRAYRGERVPPCNDVENTGPPNRHEARDIIIAMGDLTDSPIVATDSLSGYSIHDYVIEGNEGGVAVIELETEGVPLMMVMDNANHALAPPGDTDSDPPQVIEPLSSNEVFSWNSPDSIGRITWTGVFPESNQIRIRLIHSGSAASTWAVSHYSLSVKPN